MDEQIISLLKQVKYPGFSRDIVSFGLVNRAELENRKASVKLELSSPDPTLPQSLKKYVEECLLTSDLIDEVEVGIVVKKSTDGGGPQSSEEDSPKAFEGIKKIVAVASGKGGVGKSTLAVNLACALSNHKNETGEPLQVGLMDCDVYGPSVPLLIGASEKPQILRENFLAPVESYGVKVMSMGLLVDEETPVVWRGPMVMKTIQQFAENVEWGELDILLIDLPPGTGDAQLSLAQILPLDGVIIITTPQKAAMDVARRGARMFEKVNVPILGVVENMSYLLNQETQEKSFLFGQGGGPLTAQALKTGFLGEVPIDEEIRQGGDHGIPVVISNPDGSATEAFDSIAESISDLVRIG